MMPKNSYIEQLISDDRKKKSRGAFLGHKPRLETFIRQVIQSVPKRGCCAVKTLAPEGEVSPQCSCITAYISSLILLGQANFFAYVCPPNEGCRLY